MLRDELSSFFPLHIDTCLVSNFGFFLTFFPSFFLSLLVCLFFSCPFLCLFSWAFVAAPSRPPTVTSWEGVTHCLPVSPCETHTHTGREAVVGLFRTFGLPLACCAPPPLPHLVPRTASQCNTQVLQFHYIEKKKPFPDNMWREDLMFNPCCEGVDSNTLLYLKPDCGGTTGLIFKRFIHNENICACVHLDLWWWDWVQLPVL